MTASEAPDGWWILIEPELQLAEDTLVPDLAGWRRERMPGFPDVTHFTLALGVRSAVGLHRALPLWGVTRSGGA